MQRNDQALYHDYAANWWTGEQRFQRLLANQVRPRLAYFNSVSPRWQGLEVLDLGCGGGFMAEALAGQGARVTGVDPCVPLLEIARRHAQSSELCIDYREGVGEAIPLPTHSVDRVVCVDVLEHVSDLEQVLREIRRVLRPGGTFFFDTINRTWLAQLVVVVMAEDVLHCIPKGTHDPKKFIRPEELRRALHRCGFGAVSPRFVGMGPTWLNERFDFEFGLMPMTQVLYLGHAR